MVVLLRFCVGQANFRSIKAMFRGVRNMVIFDLTRVSRDIQKSSAWAIFLDYDR